MQTAVDCPNVIHLVPRSGWWFIVYQGPHAIKAVHIYGKDEVAINCPVTMTADVVISRLKGMNPDTNIRYVVHE